MQQVAVVRHIARYPVKSMRGEALAEVELGLNGIPGDREYAFVQAGSRSYFPWLTGRQLPDLLRYQPVRADRLVTVHTPTGRTLPVDGDELRQELEAASGRPLYLLRDHRGSPDAAVLSLISLATVTHIADESGIEHHGEHRGYGEHGVREEGQPESPVFPVVDLPPHVARFRPNLAVETPAGEPFAELGWVGMVLRLGETARIAITEPDSRCAMITLDPSTGEARPEVLRVVAQEHGNRAGVYATVLTPGPIRAGDRVWQE
jgi:uncharacterized protein YcbX